MSRVVRAARSIQGLSTTAHRRLADVGRRRVALYYLALACLFTHELDAITHSEWRLLFGLRDLPDPTAASAFVAFHVPLFFLVLWLSHHPSPRLSSVTKLVVAAFLIVHSVLHFALSSSPQYSFEGSLSNSLIFGAAVFGAAFLAAPWAVRLRHRLSGRASS